VAPARVATATRADALRLAEAAAAASSAPYRAPELWDAPSGAGAAVTEKTDVFALGATLFCLACGLSPFEAARGADGALVGAEPSYLRALAAVPWPAPCPLAPDAVKLVEDCLARDAGARPTAAQVCARAARLADDADAVAAKEGQGL
jgi:serine/threonine kinase 16